VNGPTIVNISLNDIGFESSDCGVWTRIGNVSDTSGASACFMFGRLIIEFGNLSQSNLPEFIDAVRSMQLSANQADEV